MRWWSGCWNHWNTTKLACPGWATWGHAAVAGATSRVAVMNSAWCSCKRRRRAACIDCCAAKPGPPAVALTWLLAPRASCPVPEPVKFVLFLVITPWCSGTGSSGISTWRRSRPQQPSPPLAAKSCRAGQCTRIAQVVSKATSCHGTARDVRFEDGRLSDAQHSRHGPSHLTLK
jgi:hypothetical protein